MPHESEFCSVIGWGVGLDSAWGKHVGAPTPALTQYFPGYGALRAEGLG